MTIRYVAVRVNNNRNNELDGKAFAHIRGCVEAINQAMEVDGDRWRVVEIPHGESLDYDGTVVVEIKTGRLW